MDYTVGTEKNGDMTMDDRGGEPNAGFDEQGVTLQNMDTLGTLLPSISPTEPLLGSNINRKRILGLNEFNILRDNNLFYF